MSIPYMMVEERGYIVIGHRSFSKLQQPHEPRVCHQGIEKGN